MASEQPPKPLSLEKQEELKKLSERVGLYYRRLSVLFPEGIPGDIQKQYEALNDKFLRLPNSSTGIDNKEIVAEQIRQLWNAERVKRFPKETPVSIQSSESRPLQENPFFPQKTEKPETVPAAAPEEIAPPLVTEEERVFLMKESAPEEESAEIASETPALESYAERKRQIEALKRDASALRRELPKALLPEFEVLENSFWDSARDTNVVLAQDALSNMRALAERGVIHTGPAEEELPAPLPGQEQPPEEIAQLAEEEPSRETVPSIEDALQPERAQELRERAAVSSEEAQPERTTGEWKETLRGLLGRTKEKFGQTTEGASEFFGKSREYLGARSAEVGNSLSALLEKGGKFGRQSIEGARMMSWLSQEEKEPKIESEEGKKLSDYVAARSKEQNTEAGKLGPWAEKHIRSLGERYNGMGWKKKLAIGAVLGASAATFSGVSPLLFGLATAGLGAQRLAGMAGMFLKTEKYAQKLSSLSEREKKVTAALLAVGYSVGMSAAVGEAVHLLSESAAGEAVHEWLKQHYPFGSSATPLATVVESPPIPDFAPLTHEPSLEALKPPGYAEPGASVPETSTAAAPEAPAAPTQPTSSAPEAPGAAQPAPVAAPEAPSAPETPVSASETPASAIPEVSVKATPEHGYEYMTKRLWEQLQDKHLNPADYPEGSDIRRLLEADAKTIDGEVHRIATDSSHASESAKITLKAEMSIDADGRLHLSETAAQTPVQEVPAQTAERVPEAPKDITKEEVEARIRAQEEATGHTYMPSITETTEVGPAPGSNLESVPLAEGLSESAGEVITNKSGLQIPIAESHIYADEGAKHLLAYGGTPAEQMKQIAAYLSENKNATVFGPDAEGKYRVPYFLGPDGKITAGLPPEIKTGFLGLGRDWMKVPGPDELRQLKK